MHKCDKNATGIKTRTPPPKTALGGSRSKFVRLFLTLKHQYDLVRCPPALAARMLSSSLQGRILKVFYDDAYSQYFFPLLSNFIFVWRIGNNAVSFFPRSAAFCNTLIHFADVGQRRGCQAHPGIGHTS